MTHKEWFYFGCGEGKSGHYLFDIHGWKAYSGSNARQQICNVLGHFDGVLTPHPETQAILYQAALTRLYGIGYSALAWWDRSTDKRGASNSIVFAPSISIDPQIMLDQAKTLMPWVFERTPVPVILWTPRA